MHEAFGIPFKNKKHKSNAVGRAVNFYPHADLEAFILHQPELVNRAIGIKRRQATKTALSSRPQVALSAGVSNHLWSAECALLLPCSKFTCSVLASGQNWGTRIRT